MSLTDQSNADPPRLIFGNNQSPATWSDITQEDYLEVLKLAWAVLEWAETIIGEIVDKGMVPIPAANVQRLSGEVTEEAKFLLGFMTVFWPGPKKEKKPGWGGV
uniref:Uncharacterized protein n=1 Tax=Candidatus Kentrum sp. LPFa TaxID=2126335 RepID=A0A450WMX7_9GAMM|nr:MAG: hypothetical protein BECKLPF1236B_GA0070989_11396 [Candidatus Kentron sp. LPFa]